MTEEQFVGSHKEEWATYENQLKSFEKRKSTKDAAGFPERYRRLCQDLNQAQACHYSASTIENLNRLVWGGHQMLYRHGSRRTSNLARTLFEDFPRQVRAEKKIVLLGHLVFYGLGLLVFFYLLANPGQTSLFMDKAEQQNLVSMYDPEAEHFLHPRETSGDADMFGFYILNNIGIGFKTFAGGAICGIGAMLLLCFNAVTLGAAMAVIAKAGLGSTFFPFVVTHSAFELTGLILFASAGLRIGWAFVAPGRLDRPSAFSAAANSMVPVIAGATMFLVLAAIIEAFWSSRILPENFKYLTGAATWVLVILFFTLGGRQRGK